MHFFEFNKQFQNEFECIEYFIKIRYNDKVQCNHCKSNRVSHRKGNPKVFDCYACHNTFSIFKDTIFEHSSTDLRKWFYAIHIFLNSNKDISGYQLQREIFVTYKTAWRMLKQIRLAAYNIKNQKFLDRFIEKGEIYVGGRSGNSNNERYK